MPAQPIHQLIHESSRHAKTPCLLRSVVKERDGGTKQRQMASGVLAQLTLNEERNQKKRSRLKKQKKTSVVAASKNPVASCKRRMAAAQAKAEWKSARSGRMREHMIELNFPKNKKNKRTFCVRQLLCSRAADAAAVPAPVPVPVLAPVPLPLPPVVVACCKLCTCCNLLRVLRMRQVEGESSSF